RRHTRFSRDWSSDVCSSDLLHLWEMLHGVTGKKKGQATLLGFCLQKKARKKKYQDYFFHFEPPFTGFRTTELLHMGFFFCYMAEIGRASCRERVSMTVVGT